jgi:hypothetical protein
MIKIPMFGTKKITVCGITHTSITVTTFVSSGKGLVVETKVEKACTPNAYPSFFSALRSELGVKRVRLLLPEQDTYLKLITFPKDTVVNRPLIIQKANEVIPESIVDGFMDWKQMPMTGDTIGVQVYVVKKEVLAPILTACEEAGIIVEACEPPSFAMARMAARVHEPFLLVYPQVKPEFICAVQDGKVLEVMSVDPLGSLEETKHTCIAYVTKIWGITIKAIATNMPDPVVGLASKTEITGVDMDVLNIPTENTREKPKRLPLPVIIGIIIVLVLAIVFFGSKLLDSTRGKSSTISTVSSNATVTPAPTEAPVVRKDLAIEVENGSGVAGLAGKGKKILEDAGYTTVTTANADNYDYVGVTVKAKTAATAAVVVSDISSSYPSATASSTLLDTSSPVDAIVILGKD